MSVDIHDEQLDIAASSAVPQRGRKGADAL
jgi:hypothetical protein